MKTTDATGLWLDFWVAKAEGKQPERFDRDGHGWVRCKGDLAPFDASSWPVAGPIIGRLGMEFKREGAGFRASFRVMDREPTDELPGLVRYPHAWGETHQVAAMRALLVSVYGDVLPELPPDPAEVRRRGGPESTQA